MMTKEEKAKVEERKKAFLAEICKRFGFTEELMTRLLKAKGLVYNQAKEAEIVQSLQEVVDREAEKMRAKLKAKIEAHPIIPPDRCWLAETPGIMCQGTIRRNGGLPECTEGGVAHFFAIRSKNPIAFLEKREIIRKEHARVQTEELARYRQEMAKPFDINQYRLHLEPQEELL